jgi:hypothetical protein
MQAAATIAIPLEAAIFRGLLAPDPSSACPLKFMVMPWKIVPAIQRQALQFRSTAFEPAG